MTASIVKKALHCIPHDRRGKGRPKNHTWRRDLEKEMWTAGHKYRVGGRTVLRANKLSHTDLKPENILFVNSEFEVIDVIRPGNSKKVMSSRLLLIL